MVEASIRFRASERSVPVERQEIFLEEECTSQDVVCEVIWVRSGDRFSRVRQVHGPGDPASSCSPAYTPAVDQ